MRSSPLSCYRHKPVCYHQNIAVMFRQVEIEDRFMMGDPVPQLPNGSKDSIDALPVGLFAPCHECFTKPSSAPETVIVGE